MTAPAGGRTVLRGGCWLALLGLLSGGAGRAGAQAIDPRVEEHLEAAQRAQARQDCPTAAREYGAAVRLLPSSAELWSNEGVALYCAADLPSATAAFTKARSLNAQLFAPHLFLGLAASRQGETNEAIAELKSALRVNPSDPTAHLWLGYTYVSVHQFEAGLPEFSAVLQSEPKNPDARYAMGECWMEIGRQDAAKLAQLAPKGQYLLRLAAEQYAMEGDAARAEAISAEAARAAPTQAAAADRERLQEERLYREAHEAEANARQAFDSVLRDTPESYRAHQIAADIDVADDKLPDAIAEYRKVLELNPDLPGVHEAISNCLMRTYHSAEALDELRAELRLQPHSPEVFTEIGQVQFALGDVADASASLRQAVQEHDPPTEAYLLLGKVALAQHEAPPAILALQVAVRRDPRSATAYFLLSRAYRITGDKAAMARCIDEYKQFSEDERERQVAARVTQGPHAPPPVMDAKDERDAQALVSAGP